VLSQFTDDLGSPAIDDKRLAIADRRVGDVMIATVLHLLVGSWCVAVL